MEFFIGGDLCNGLAMTVTSPASSVCRTRVFPSDFTILPVRWSPFFKVI